MTFEGYTNEEIIEAWKQCNNTPLTRFLNEDEMYDYMQKWIFQSYEVGNWLDEMAFMVAEMEEECLI